MVKDFKKEPAATENGNRSQAEEPEQRIPNWGTIITQFAKRKWATELKQIPASVIDNGILQNVPYISFSAAYGYELNIYGDPDSPAGVEIGVTRYLLNNNSAKSNCIEFITSILPSDYDRTTLLQLKWIRDFKVLNGFTFEITPPTDADAYGGWWISVYDTNKLNIARASERELHDITEFRQAIAQHPRSAANTSVAIKTNTAPSTWTGEDFRSTYSHRSVSSGGSVFVRGYYRKDGTYVQSHTRRAPRR